MYYIRFFDTTLAYLSLPPHSENMKLSNYSMALDIHEVLFQGFDPKSKIYTFYVAVDGEWKKISHQEYDKRFVGDFVYANKIETDFQLVFLDSYYDL